MFVVVCVWIVAAGTVTAFSAAGAVGIGAGVWYLKKVRAKAPVTCGVQSNDNRLFWRPNYVKNHTNISSFLLCFFYPLAIMFIYLYNNHTGLDILLHSC